MSAKEQKIWGASMEAYQCWDEVSWEGHMMPVSVLAERLHDLGTPQEVMQVLEKGEKARLIELRQGIVETYFLPLTRH
jgi:hypothetical protein